MHNKTISELNEEYELELPRIIKTINKKKAKRVLLQFPDGMKPYSWTIVSELEKQLPKTQFFIWLGSCFGACDVPIILGNIKIDLIVQFGHSDWNYREKERVRIVGRG